MESTRKSKAKAREYLRKSPDGYYVLVLNEEEFNVIRQLLVNSDIIVEGLGVGKYIIKVKSRRTYMKMLRRLGVS